MLVKVYCTGWYFADLPDTVNPDDYWEVYNHFMKQAGNTFPMSLNDLCSVWETDDNGGELIAEW